MVETSRLLLRELNTDDAPFILRLLNDPSWIENIGDRNVYTVEEAQAYIINGPLTMIAQYGFGLLLVTTKEENVPIGLCGLIKRETLDDVDLGFAFLPEFWGQGYAYEAAAATLSYTKSSAKEPHPLSRVVAITLERNLPCIKLLKKLGFQFEQKVLLDGDDEELELYGLCLNTLHFLSTQKEPDYVANSPI